MDDIRLRLVGQDDMVPVVGGGERRGVNLDFGASAPALQAVADAVAEFLPLYSSVHRGAGWKSQLSTQAYELARERVGSFVGARDDDVVVLTKHTTDALNLLSMSLPDRTHVVTYAGEHHANLLPWRRGPVTTLPVPESREAAVVLLDDALRAHRGEDVLVAVTGACNVTGEKWPVAELAAVAHAHGARIVVDAAQLAPHAPLHIGEWDVDWVALSGHKMYAPYGCGALVGRRDWLELRDPPVRGGGAVRFVTLDDVAWQPAPERLEAGSPNVVGAVALGVACDVLAEVGMDRVADAEQDLGQYLADRLDEVPGLRRYTIWPHDGVRIAVAAFNLDGWEHTKLATVLSAEYGIAVRDGCFCAHPLMLRLLDVPADEAHELQRALAAGEDPPMPGAVRASSGVSTTRADVDALVGALQQVVVDGARWSYREVGPHGRYVPDPDDRPIPAMRSLSGVAAIAAR
jgi:selenocysteine lyase/cysteine desulfurase